MTNKQYYVLTSTLKAYGFKTEDNEEYNLATDKHSLFVQYCEDEEEGTAGYYTVEDLNGNELVSETFKAPSEIMAMLETYGE